MDRSDEVRAFVAARGTALSRTAYLLTGNRHAAEDLVQETYVEMVRQWSRIERANPEPYVRRIMYSRFVDGLRRSRDGVRPSGLAGRCAAARLGQGDVHVPALDP